MADATASAVDASGVDTRGVIARPLLVWLARLLLLLAVIAVWHAVTVDDEYWRTIVSSPRDVVLRLAGWLVDPKWWQHFAATMEEASLGYLLGVGIALALVAIITPSRLLTRFFAPFIAALNSLPKIALAPLFIFWFGTTLQSKVYFVASLICFIVFQGIHTGLRTIDPALRDNTRLLGASKLHMVWHLYVPAILTWIISSLRLSWAFALLSAVIGEYLGSNRGLGYLIANGQQSLRADLVIAGILVVATLAVAFDRALRGLQHRMSTWRAF
jgi:NitT/TauT family transport system permease protein